MFDDKLNERDLLDPSSLANRRSWANGIIVSVALHVAIAVTLVVGGSFDDGVAVRRPNILPQLTDITLLSAPDAIAQAPQHRPAALPQPMPASVSRAAAALVTADRSLAPATPSFATGSATTKAASSLSTDGVAGTLPAADLAAIGSDYRRRLFEHIAERQQSPPAGTPLGTVVVRFSLERDGDVLSIAVASSSGYAALDRAAVDSVRNASPMPPIPAGFPDRLSVAFPVDFGRLGRQAGISRP